MSGRWFRISDCEYLHVGGTRFDGWIFTGPDVNGQLVSTRRAPECRITPKIGKPVEIEEFDPEINDFKIVPRFA